jgi:penicillin amidase
MKIFRAATMAAAILALAAAATVFGALRLALPVRHGTHVLPGLAESVRIRFDEAGAPHIAAANREDAFAALGYVTAGDRLFQMDLLRRKSAGRLAEIFGPALLESDRFARTMNFDRLADAILERLPADQKRALEAYARGVERAMRDFVVKPFEFLALAYEPDPWRPRDSILVALTFAEMSASIESERAATVMRAVLPSAVVDFLTPESDCYNEALAPRSPERCAAGARPPEELRPLLRAGGASRGAAIFGAAASRGSNAWAVSRARTADGRAILASDMHLVLEQPNVWYRAHLAYGAVAIEGLTYPGAPLVVVGSNGRVAWGLTNLDGDLTDLVRLRPAGDDATKYATAQGPRDYSIRREQIRVRGREDARVEIKETVFGPVLPEPLLGGETALRWTMLDPAATNLDLMNMDRAADVRGALRILQGAGVPPLNAVVADASGSIGWTIMGTIPKRRGFSGRFAEFWDEGGVGWDGYFSPQDLPVVVDPPEGFIVSANQRMLGAADFAPEIGHDYSGGFRAWRIAERLRASASVVEADMGALQLDSSAEYYRHDRDVALEALRASKTADPEAADLLRALEGFDGRAETDSLGLRLVLEFRSALAEATLAPLLERCRALEPQFRYVWSNADTPLRAMIDALRSDAAGDEWNALVVDALRRAAARLRAASGAASVADVLWGEENRVEMAHPLSGASSLVAPLLDMPKAEVAGCPHCVRYHAVSHGGNSLGANARLVASPGHEEDGLLQMAGGQSGQPASPHYADLQADWVAGRWRALRARSFESELALEPARGGDLAP